VRHLYGRDQYYKDIKEGTKHRLEALDKLRRMGGDKRYYEEFHRKWKDLYGGVPVYRDQKTPFDPNINYNDDVTDVQFGYSDLNAEELMKFRKFMRENPDDDDDDDDDDD